MNTNIHLREKPYKERESNTNICNRKAHSLIKQAVYINKQYLKLGTLISLEILVSLPVHVKMRDVGVFLILFVLHLCLW